ncbi:HAD-IB family phosphatase [Pseudokordiimonas caeni]|uniref:HAD-IB family phosphatase n=1 Tax=Pseudokordiimonas caeni TaxID=2997908 RepID=UPI00281236C7|nr:HAD-IB family phosphatase [Pseudokordiimonas caeni]
MHDGLAPEYGQVNRTGLASATVHDLRPATVANPVAAILLAGSRREGDPLKFGGQGKAMLQIDGQAMLAHVIGTLARTAYIDRFLIVSDEDLTGDATLRRAARGLPMEHVPAGATICRSVLAARKLVPVGQAALLTTADNPLLTPAAATDFLSAAQRNEGLTVGMVPRQVIQARYPESRRTYYKFRDVDTTGANLYFLNGETVDNMLTFWEQVEQHRKKPLKVVKSFGWLNVIGMVMRRFTITEAFARAGRTVGCPVRPHLLKEAEAAMDVDTQKDFETAERILQLRKERIVVDPGAIAALPDRHYAVFDLDRTLTRSGTFTPFLLSTRKGIFAKSVLMLRILRHMILYKAKRINRTTLKNRMLAVAFRHMTREEVEAAADRFARHVLDNQLRGGGLIAVAMHKMDRDDLVLATASIDLYAEPIARALGFKRVVCTRTAFPGGDTPPVVNGENCYGDEKSRLLKDTLLDAGAMMREKIKVTFYSDHYTDMPLLDWADTPIVISPDVRTRGIAMKRGHRIAYW